MFIDRCLWSFLIMFPISMLLAVPDQRTAEERWDSDNWAFSDRVEYQIVCTCTDDLDPLPPPPPFDLESAAWDDLTVRLGGFQHLAQLETPLSGALPRRVRAARARARTLPLDLEHVAAVADP